MIQYYVHEKMILDAAKSYQTIFDVINKAEPELVKTFETQFGATFKQTSF